VRNYFNIIQLHNILIDLNVFNNEIFNTVIKNLNLKLNKYNFKFSSNININLYTDQKIDLNSFNKDTILLKNIFEKWNKYRGSQYIRKWKKYKRMLNWLIRDLYKGKDWYKSVKKNKLKGNNLFTFNSGRYIENTKTEISNSMGFWENLHQLKKLPYNKNIKAQFQKTQAWYAYFKRRHGSKKHSFFYISNYIKLKNIPFKYIYKEFNIIFLEHYRIKEIKNLSFEFETYFNKIKKIEKTVLLFKNYIIDWKMEQFLNLNNKNFFLKKFNKNLQNIIIWKNEVPSLLVTEMRVKRIPPIVIDGTQLNDFISMSHTDEMQQLLYYKKLSKKGCLKNVYLKTRYIYKKYPYRINKNKNKFYQINLKNYFNLIDTGIKVLKKFYFFDRSKLRYYNRLAHRLLNKIDTVYGNQLLKYKYWDKVFFLKRLNEKNLDFWSFYDYLKINKYKNFKNKNNFTLFFLNRWKKDYYHMRVYLLRIISFLHYYTTYKKIKINNNFSFLEFLENIKKESLNITEKNNEKPEEMDEKTFYHSQLRWHFKELLHQPGSNEFGNKEKFMYIINLFYKKFNKYFIEYNKINKYNDIYKYKVKSFKLKVLRKINNLKKFFFFQNKRNKGLRIFSYLNTFSIKYHFKHLLWHSPYSSLLFKKNNIIEDIQYKKVFSFFYFYQKTKYNIINYSYIFNLFLNIIDIKEEW
jgi:hypothetical protein